MKDRNRAHADERSGDPAGAAYVRAIDKHPDVLTQLSGLVPDLELESGVTLFQGIEQLPDGIRREGLVGPRAVLPKPPIEPNVDHRRTMGRHVGVLILALVPRPSLRGPLHRGTLGDVARPRCGEKTGAGKASPKSSESGQARGPEIMGNLRDGRDFELDTEKGSVAGRGSGFSCSCPS
jgi:hypothetical protein